MRTPSSGVNNKLQSDGCSSQKTALTELKHDISVEVKYESLKV